MVLGFRADHIHATARYAFQPPQGAVRLLLVGVEQGELHAAVRRPIIRGHNNAAALKGRARGGEISCAAMHASLLECQTRAEGACARMIAQRITDRERVVPLLQCGSGLDELEQGLRSLFATRLYCHGLLERAFGLGHVTIAAKSAAQQHERFLPVGTRRMCGDETL